MHAARTIQLDALIFGGGVAGLWLLDQLREEGFAAALVERSCLGDGQTICAQGIIHGGLKYTLDGLFDRSAERIRHMPERWLRSLRGEQLPDLRDVGVLSTHCHLWRTESVRSRAGLIGARMGLRTRPAPISDERRPPALAECPGSVHRLSEPVIDPARLLEVFKFRNLPFLVRAGSREAPQFEPSNIADRPLRVTLQTGGRSVRFLPRRIVLTAGAGNETLGTSLDLKLCRTQRRPLHMVMVRGNMPELYGHCVDGAKTRITVSSNTASTGERVWQVGGQIAERGVLMEREELIRCAFEELTAVLPGVDLSRARFATYRIDRAEPRSRTGRRPDDAVHHRERGVFVAWPTKLALAPVLAQRIISEVGPVVDDAEALRAALTDAERPSVAQPPWETVTEWSDAL